MQALPFHQGVVLVVVVLLIVLLYKEWINPALTFFGAVLVFLLTGVLTPSEALAGLSNQQVAVIFMLMLITSGVRLLYGGGFFFRIFSDSLTPRQFLGRMMVSVSTVSAFLNNTPIVAFLIPYIRDWAERNKQPASKFLIPLSHATIAGGMITVIGTSTNLILQGLLSQYNLPLLRYTDFIFLGLAVTILVWVYYLVVGYHLLPSHPTGTEAVKTNIKEYIVETEVFPGSLIAGKTVKEAGLRNLKDLFLVEILRGGDVISPVSPEEQLASGDILFFSGNTGSILNLIREDNGLRILKEDKLSARGQFHFTEAVIPAHSDLIGTRIRQSDFRNRYNASIIAIHRDGKRVSGKVGETVLAGGDFLLLLIGEEHRPYGDERNLYLISSPVKIKTRKPWWQNFLGAFVLGGLVLGILGPVPLFSACLLILAALVGFRILSVTEIRRQIDLSLLAVLVSSLAIGTALIKSGAAGTLASGIVYVTQGWGVVPILAVLFLCTTLVTSLITNAAAVAIMFPIALSLSQLTGVEGTPFFVAIAFAASGDFITPIGYQTNLMVYGPGGYSFRDFFKVGLLLTLLYMVTCIGYIALYYHPGQ
jgi:di/tricarboxylate transporter